MIAKPTRAPKTGDWLPTPRQGLFLAKGCYEALYGGAAGGGKSDALLMHPLRRIHHPTYRALLLRRTFPELEATLIERSQKWYRSYGAEYSTGRKLWRFPSGAVIRFGYLTSDRDVHQYQSDEFQDIVFDELTSFTEHQYIYLLSRLRSAQGLPVHVRAGTNPGNEGHEWVMRRWAPWLDPKFPVQAKPGETRYYVNVVDKHTRREEWVPRGTPGALGRTFVPALASDNPHLAENDPEYVLRLDNLDPVTRQQLKYGDWLAKPGAGKFFQRTWFGVLDEAPKDVATRVRYWDRAATEKKKSNKDPDYTAGVLMSKTHDKHYIVEDVVRVRARPRDVEALIKKTTELDGAEVQQWLSRDPGSAGVFEADYYIRELAGYDVHAKPETGDKTTRAKPFSAQCEGKNVSVVRGSWNRDYFEELEGFPDGGHDDQVDASSGAFSVIFHPEETGAEQLRKIYRDAE